MTTNRAIIHIGMHKTGSTAIQHACHKHSRKLLKRGFCYPTTGTLWYGHHPVAWASGVPHPCHDEKLNINNLIDTYIKQSTSKTLILSSEDFFKVPNPCKSPAIEAITQAFRGIDVLAYIRNPCDWVVSSFKWNVERDPKLFPTINNFVENCNLKGWFNFSKALKAWNKVDGSKIWIRPYVPNVVLDFTTFMGIDTLPPTERSNTSIRSLAALIVGELALDPTLALPDNAAKIVDQIVRDITDADINLLDEELAQKIIHLTEKQLRLLAEQYPELDIAPLLVCPRGPEGLDASEAMRVCESALQKLPWHSHSRAMRAMHAIDNRLHHH